MNNTKSTSGILHSMAAEPKAEQWSCHVAGIGDKGTA